MDSKTWEQTLQLMVTTDKYDNWLRTTLFTCLIIGTITVVGTLLFMKKIKVKTFTNIYMFIIVTGSALVFAERDLQKVPITINGLEDLGLYLWWFAWLSAILLGMWFLRSIYCNIWNEKAYHWQLLFITLLIVFQPTFFETVKAQFYATPVQRLYTVVSFADVPRWDKLINQQIHVMINAKPSIANMLIVLLYIAVWLSFVMLFIKIFKKFECRTTKIKVLDQIIKYGILIPLYFWPIPTIIAIGILPFNVKEPKKEQKEEKSVVGTFRRW